MPKPLRGLLRGAARRVRDRLRTGPAPGTPVRVSFGARGTGEGKVGDSLLETAKALRIDIEHYCGGQCSCSTCRVRVIEGPLTRMDLNEEVVLGATAVGKGYRLACQARLQGDVEVEIPDFFNASG